VGFAKTVKLGSVSGEYFGYKRGQCAVEIEVEVRERPEGVELAMSGSVWKPNRSDIVSGGQNYDEIAALFPSSRKVGRMIAVWKRWHLNGMNAACPHQRAYARARGLEPHQCFTTSNGHVERKFKIDKLPREPHGPFAVLEPHVIWQLPELVDERPSRCFDCGYSYGSAWLYEPLPPEIIEEVRSW
jgi:hypothetical protein